MARISLDAVVSDATDATNLPVLEIEDGDETYEFRHPAMLPEDDRVDLESTLRKLTDATSNSLADMSLADAETLLRDTLVSTSPTLERTRAFLRRRNVLELTGILRHYTVEMDLTGEPATDVDEPATVAS